MTTADETHWFLPAAVCGTEVGACAFPDSIGSFDRPVVCDADGERLDTVEPPSADPAVRRELTSAVCRPRHVRLTIIPGLLLAVLATACGDTDRSVLSRPTASDEVVVQVMVTGGFVPRGTAVSTVPTATVLGDGTVVTAAPVIAIYPGPAITPLQSVRVPAETVDDLVKRAADLGLLAGALEFGRFPVADAPDTIVTITVNGREHRHVANALGAGGRLDDVGPQISEHAAANRRALASFVAAVEVSRRQKSTGARRRSPSMRWATMCRIPI